MFAKNYQYVIAVAEAGNFSKAAAGLFIAQSSLSQYIKNLEEEIGVQLFDRSHQPITLTTAGEKYLKTAYEIQYLEKRLTKQLQSLQSVKKGHLTIGITRYWGSLLLPRILPNFQAKYPAIDVIIREGRTTDIVDLLKKKQVDCAFFTPPNQLTTLPGIEFTKIWQEEIKLAYSAKLLSSVEPNGVIVLSQLKKLPFILLHQGQKMRQIADDYFAEWQIQPRIVMETENITTAYKLASVGFAATFIPENINQLTTPTGEVAHLHLAQPYFWQLTMASFTENEHETVDFLLLLAQQTFITERTEQV